MVATKTIKMARARVTEAMTRTWGWQPFANALLQHRHPRLSRQYTAVLGIANRFDMPQNCLLPAVARIRLWHMLAHAPHRLRRLRLLHASVSSRTCLPGYPSVLVQFATRRPRGDRERRALGFRRRQRPHTQSQRCTYRHCRKSANLNAPRNPSHRPRDPPWLPVRPLPRGCEQQGAVALECHRRRRVGLTPPEKQLLHRQRALRL